MPHEVELLIEKRKLDILAHHQAIESVEDYKDQLRIKFTKEASNKIAGDELFMLCHQLFTKPQFKALNNQIILMLPKGEQWLERVNQLLETVIKNK